MLRLNAKKLPLLVIAIAFLFVSVATFLVGVPAPSVSAQEIPAGCPGGPPGPAAPGTNCPATPGHAACHIATAGGPCVAGAGPRCWTPHTGGSMVGNVTTCQPGPGRNLQPNHCYEERRGGPNGDLLGYNEVNCAAIAQEADQARAEAEARANSAGQRQALRAQCVAENINSSNCVIVRWLIRFTNALSMIVGIAVVTMVAVGGIQYSASKDNPQATAAAKDKIRNALIALLVYIFMFGFLQWLIPGGLF